MVAEKIEKRLMKTPRDSYRMQLLQAIANLFPSCHSFTPLISRIVNRPTGT